MECVPARDYLPEKQELYQLAISADRCPGLSITVSAVRLRPPAPGRPEISFNVPQIVCDLGPFCIGEHRLI